MKICTKCGIEKSETEFWKKKGDRLDSRCKECTRARHRKQYAADPEKSKTKARAWVKQNPNKVSAYRKQYRNAHHETVLAKERKRYERHRITAKRWVVNNRQRRAEWGRRYYAQYREQHQDRCNAYCRKWYQAHKHVARARRMRRRAVELGAAGAATAAQIAWRWDMWGSRCWICSKPARETDHVRPLIDGGSNHPANLRPVCRSCNTKRKKQWLGIQATLKEAADIRARYRIKIS